jgi:peptide deformylase
MIISENGEDWGFDEGCLSIPFIRENIQRKSILKIKYFDENFNEHIDTFSGLLARVIQHEYDHIEGVLFTDKLSSFKKRLINKKLQKISSGKVSPDYLMNFYKSPKKIN